MSKWDSLREAELRVLARSKAEMIMLLLCPESIHPARDRDEDDMIVTELAAEISAIGCAIARQRQRVN